MAGDFEVVLLVGAPRSGTTWLQNMLGDRPEVAAPQETHLFDEYVRRWNEAWFAQLGESASDWRMRRFVGLPAVLTHDEFRGLVRSVILDVYGRVAGFKPGARVVLDKTPAHGRHLDLVAAYLPEAKVLHLVRDGRDVASSLVKAGRGWGWAWAPSELTGAASLWRGDVLMARRLSAGLQYMEIRYEDLLRDGAKTLMSAFSFCGVEVSLEEAEGLLDRYSIDHMRLGEGRPVRSVLFAGEAAERGAIEAHEPAGFFGEASQGGWEEAWTHYEKWLFGRVAGDLLQSLGYAKAGWEALGRVERSLYPIRHRLVGLVDHYSRLLRRLPGTLRPPAGGDSAWLSRRGNRGGGLGGAPSETVPGRGEGSSS